MAKYVLLFFTGILLTASDPYYGDTLFEADVPDTEIVDVREKSWMSTDAFKDYVHDYDDRVSDTFSVNEFYYPNVYFWFLIYTQFESNSVVLHDKNNLSLIYKVLDFSSLHKKKLSNNVLYILQRKITEEKQKALKAELAELEKDPFSLSASAKKIYRTLETADVKIPINREERIKFFHSLKENLRSQTGQKNFIQAGIDRSRPYRPFLKKLFTDKNLPVELLSIPFLESSFNPRAHSKVNALGIWQFMPLIGSYFLPMRTNLVDYRANVGLSSLAAAHLLSENIRIMKSWDLAVTAYNSGTRHLLKTKRELASEKVDLEAIIKHSDSERFGFASKNFYSEFLALAHSLAYKEKFFKTNEDEQTASGDLKFYMTKCSLRLTKELSKNDLEKILSFNNQLKDPSSNLPRGFLLTSMIPLNSKKFKQVSYNDVLKIRPKDWDKFLKGQSCSTR